MSKALDVEIVHALDKDPTDIVTVTDHVGQLAELGESYRLAQVAYLMADKLGNTERKLDLVLEEIKSLRNSVENTSFVKVATLARRLADSPELMHGFTKYVYKGKPKLQYNGSKEVVDMYEGYDRLLERLKLYYGYKEIKYSTLAQALLRAFNLITFDKETVDIADEVSTMLAIADYLYEKSNKKKITIPEIKKEGNIISLSSRQIKDSLIKAGWNIVKNGSCHTLFFKKLE